MTNYIENNQNIITIQELQIEINQITQQPTKPIKTITINVHRTHQRRYITRGGDMRSTWIRMINQNNIETGFAIIT